VTDIDYVKLPVKGQAAISLEFSPMHKTVVFTLTLFLASTGFAAEAPPGHPTVTPADRALHSAMATPQLPNKGKVVEAIDAGDYTYIRVVDAGQEEWIAVSHTAVKEGDLVRYSKGSLMRNFHSKALDRTFDSVLFAGSIKVEGAHPTVAEAADMLNIQAAPAALPNQGRVLSTIPSNAYTYIEVEHEGKTQWLAAPQVALEKGALIRYGEGAIMTNFYSKKLDREFPEVLFLGGVQVVTE
jgi:hypothetical protein